MNISFVLDKRAALNCLWEFFGLLKRFAELSWEQSVNELLSQINDLLGTNILDNQIKT